jgi:hypothetical protein
MNYLLQTALSLHHAPSAPNIFTHDLSLLIDFDFDPFICLPRSQAVCLLVDL